MTWILIAWAAANVGLGLFLVLVHLANRRVMNEPVPDVVAEEIARLEALWREEYYGCPRCRADMVASGLAWVCDHCGFWISMFPSREQMK